MKIKVMPFLQKKGNHVAKAAVEFDSIEDGIMRGFQFVGFTICDDPEKGMFVLFPCSLIEREGIKQRQYFFLRPLDSEALHRLETAILDVYESMVAFNNPHVVKLPIEATK